MAHLRWQKSANGSDMAAIAQIRWQSTPLLGKFRDPDGDSRPNSGHRDLHLDQTAMCPLWPFNPFLVSDLDRPFGHPGYMVDSSVTPMHHLTIVVSSAAPAGGG
jgi:hypothetical protein